MKKRTLTLILMFSILINSILPIGVLAESKSEELNSFENKEEVNTEYGGLSKKVSQLGKNPDEFIIDLEVTGDDRTKEIKTDIVLLVDVSDSMTYEVDKIKTNSDRSTENIKTNRLIETKKALNNFVDNTLLKDKKNTRIAIITFSDDAKLYTDFTNDKDKLKSEIDDLEGENATFTQLGLKKAYTQLLESDADEKYTILITDGEPSTSYIGNNWKNAEDNEMRDTKSYKDDNKWYYTDYKNEFYYDNIYYRDEIFRVTMSEGIQLKKSGVDVFFLGISIQEGLSSFQKYALENIATSDEHVFYLEDKNLDSMSKMVNEISKKTYKSIEDGSIIDPMGSQVKLKSTKEVKNEEELLKDGGYLIEVKSSSEEEKNKILGNLKIDVKENEININGLNLGHNDSFKIRYLIKLNTEDKNFVENHMYEANGETYLIPNIKTEEKFEFNVPRISGKNENRGIKIYHYDNNIKELGIKTLEKPSGKTIADITMPKNLENTEEINLEFIFDENLVPNKDDFENFINNIKNMNNQLPIQEDYKKFANAINYIKRTDENSIIINLKSSEKVKLSELSGKTLGVDISYNLKENAIYGEENKFKIEGKISYKNNNESINLISNELYVINPSINIPIEKIWNGKVAEEVSINLFGDNNIKEKKTLILNKGNNWKDEFKNLRKLNSNGLVKYTIYENNIEGYISQIEFKENMPENGAKIINTEIEKEVPKIIEIPVKIEWIGKEQGEVSVKLFDNDKSSERVTISKENNWTRVFSFEEGKFKEYNIKEIGEKNGYIELDGTKYKVGISGNEKSGFVITNTEVKDEGTQTDPEVPETPGESEGPEVPETPGTPGEPEGPEVPETPGTPGESEGPEVPETPGEPEVPEAPEIPETPGESEGPEVPEIPGTPGESEGPEVPEIPETPKKTNKRKTKRKSLKSDRDQKLKDTEIIRKKVNIIEEKDNFAYVHGYPDGTFRPKNGITRAEATAIFARVKNHRLILSNNYIDKYNDVLEKDWYSKYIAHLDNENIINGYSDGSFKPNNKITRAEFVTMLNRFENIVSNKSSFEDTKDHWANDSINAVKEMNLINGYKDDTFRPDEYITREEVVTIMNKYLNRKLDRDFAYNNSYVIRYGDVSLERWSHDDIVEASNSYKYIKSENDVKWVRLLNEYK